MDALSTVLTLIFAYGFYSFVVFMALQFIHMVVIEKNEWNVRPVLDSIILTAIHLMGFFLLFQLFKNPDWSSDEALFREQTIMMISIIVVLPLYFITYQSLKIFNRNLIESREEEARKNALGITDEDETFDEEEDDEEYEVLERGRK